MGLWVDDRTTCYRSRGPDALTLRTALIQGLKEREEQEQEEQEHALAIAYCFQTKEKTAGLSIEINEKNEFILSQLGNRRTHSGNDLTTRRTGRIIVRFNCSPVVLPEHVSRPD